MPDMEKVIKETKDGISFAESRGFGGLANTMRDVLELLKEQDAMNVDVFVQWCIDSHIMGDATIRGIKYWVEKYKEIKKVGEVKMDDKAFIVSRMLESKIAIAENNDQNTLIVTLDVLKEILAMMKEQDAEIRQLRLDLDIAKERARE